MGANRTPTMKNKGKTLLGVRIGLDRQASVHPGGQGGYSGSDGLTARPSIAAVEKQCLMR